MKVCLLSFIAAVAAAFAGAAVADDARVRLRIMETTDLHMHVVDYDYYQDRKDVTVGLARTATLIRQARAEVPNSLLVDNGDLLQGNPLGDFVARERGLADGEIHPMYKAMNLIGYDVANVGNHEFNFGLEFLQRSIAGADFPYVSANVFHDDGDEDEGNDRPYFEQYRVLERTVTADDGSEHVLKVGFIGLVPPQIMQWDMTHLAGRVIARDMVDTALQLVPEMRAAGADIVVAIPHSGMTVVTRQGMDEHATYYLSKVPGIDAILFGHSHLVFPSATFAGLGGVDLDAGTINGVPATMPGAWGSHLGWVDLELVRDDGAWRIVRGSGHVRPIAGQRDGETVALVEPDPEILAAVRDDHAAAVDYVRTGVGELTAPVNSFFALVRDDPSVQIVSDAQRRYVERMIRGSEYYDLPVLSASAPFKSGGRDGGDYYTDIAAGDIALKHVADLYVYPNLLRAVLMTGAEVREWLEMSASIFHRIDPAVTKEQPLINRSYPSFNFDVIDGVSYRIDVSRPPRYDPDGNLVNPDSHRIVDLRHAGEPVTGDAVFVVATNSYRAGGGGHFPGMDGDNIVIEAPDSNRDVLADYILASKVIDPRADGNWSFAAIDGDVLVTFRSALRAERHIGAESPIELLGADEQGAGRYRIRLGR